MERIPANSRYPVLVRVDRDIKRDVVLATYKTSETQYTNYKNNKPIGWSSSKVLSLHLHDMYLSINGFLPLRKIPSQKPS